MSVFKVDLPIHEGSYKWSGGRSVDVFDCTVVRIRTNRTMIEGFGEVTPLGPFYLPAFGEGARTGIKELIPHLLGMNPCEIHKINDMMDKSLLGHAYVKSAIDMACWDILGKVSCFNSVGSCIETSLGDRSTAVCIVWRKVRGLYRALPRYLSRYARKDGR